MGNSSAKKQQPSSDIDAFKDIFRNARHVVAITGAGISAESGIPTFRGASGGGVWRKFNPQDLATPEAFATNPSLVWKFHSFGRDLILSKKPNPAHYALAKAEEDLRKEKRKLIVITQNVDELHSNAGTTNLIELHGNIFKVRCTKCNRIEENRDSPICPALAGTDPPEVQIPVKELPSCKKCGGLVRPHVVWFGETLDINLLQTARQEMERCDLCLVIGTSSVVYPAAMLAPAVARRGIPVAEFNIEKTTESQNFSFHFEGPCGTTLPKALSV